jgi:hypothetical protein
MPMTCQRPPLADLTASIKCYPDILQNTDKFNFLNVFLPLKLKTNAMKIYSLKSLLLFAVIGLSAVSCQLGPKPQQADQQEMPGVHKAVVLEVIQTTMYTYLHVEEKDGDKWLALPGMEAKANETYYYTGGMEMNNFESKELGRTFPTVYFIESVSKSPDLTAKDEMSYPHSGSKTKTEKQQVNVQPAQGGITIAELYKNKSSYAGKKVKIKGQVTKFNANIMDKNWIHLQDGTDFEGRFDLTTTTATVVAVGDVITLEGVVNLDKDFGYGYSYEILLEDAALIEQR